MEKSLSEPSLCADACTSIQTRTMVTDGRGAERIGQWFGHWRKPIRQWIGRNASVTSAEIDDLTQEVFVRLLRYSKDVMVTNPKSYLFTVAMNVVSAWQSYARVRMPHDDVGLAELLLDPHLEPDPLAERAQSEAILWAAVASLPTRRRELLLLHVSEGLTYKQIAHQKNLTYRTVLRDLTRAYITLRKQLAVDDGGGPCLHPMSSKAADGDRREDSDAGQRAVNV